METYFDLAKRKKWANLQDKIDYKLLEKQLMTLMTLNKTGYTEDNQNDLIAIEELLSAILSTQD